MQKSLPSSSLFIVWKSYQRRVEVLAPQLGSRIIFLHHIFRTSFLRPIDYVYKLFAGLWIALRQRPDFIVAQAPPLYSALTALLLRIPYIVDAHNPVFQNVGGRISWGKLPLSGWLIRNASAVIVHNNGILHEARKAYPQVSFFNIPDPLVPIRATNAHRIANQIMVICSFDPDEPIGILLESIAALPAYTFVITANPSKLTQHARSKLEGLPNVKLTGFLSNEDYQAYLCGSAAALVLTNKDLIQPSGACEALSSDTQLIISRTSLIEELFGDWAILVENTAPSIVSAISALVPRELDLSDARRTWNRKVAAEIDRLLLTLES